MFLDLTPEQVAFNSRHRALRARGGGAARRRHRRERRVPVRRDPRRRGRGLHGVTVPTAWGGAGRDYVSYALAIEAIARASATVAVSLVVTNSLVAELIEHAGTDAADASGGCGRWRAAR